MAQKILSFIEDFHLMYRFGHTSDIHTLFDEKHNKDYKDGVFFIFCLFIALIIIWIITLIALRLFSHRVGCASGKPIAILAESTSNSGGYVAQSQDEFGISEYNDWTESGTRKTNFMSEASTEYVVVESDNNRVRRTYHIFIISGMLLITGSILFMVGLSNSMVSLSDTFTKVSDIRSHLPDLTISTTQIFNLFEGIKEDVSISYDNLDEICPAKSYSLASKQNNSKIIDDTSSVTELNATKIIDDYNTSMISFNKTFAKDEWREFAGTIDNADSLLTDIQNLLVIGNRPSAPWYIAGIAIFTIIIFIAIFLMATARNSFKEGYQLVQGYGNQRDRFDICLDFTALPIFTLVVSLCGLTAGAFVVLLLVNSDFCFGEIKTGQTALKIIVNMKFHKWSQLYNATDKYLHGCTPSHSSPLQFINDAVSKSLPLISSMIRYVSWVENIDGSISPSCITLVEESTESTSRLYSKLIEFNKHVTYIKDATACDRLAPLIQEATFGSTCTSTPKGLLWCFVSAYIAAVSGMTMISLRSTLYRAQVYSVAPQLQVNCNNSFASDGRRRIKSPPPTYCINNPDNNFFRSGDRTSKTLESNYEFTIADQEAFSRRPRRDKRYHERPRRSRWDHEPDYGTDEFSSSY